MEPWGNEWEVRPVKEEHMDGIPRYEIRSGTSMCCRSQNAPTASRGYPVGTGRTLPLWPLDRKKKGIYPHWPAEVDVCSSDG